MVLYSTVALKNTNLQYSRGYGTSVKFSLLPPTVLSSSVKTNEP